MKFLEKILAKADVKLNGNRPWDITVNNKKAFSRAIFSGILGIGDSFVNEEWDCPAVDQLVDKLIRAQLLKYVYRHPAWMFHATSGYLLNSGTRLKANHLARRHYDLGNDLFQVMLDQRMVYTCAYWGEGASNLDQAQEKKLAVLCQKLQLKPGMRVLDIGGGWGSLAKYAAQRYGVSVVNITISKEQVKLANQLCRGLQVENRLMDYRDLNEQFDRIVSVEMLEAVGYKNYRQYFQIVHNCLANNGIFVLQTIGGRYSTTHTNPWIEKYIFPGGMLPSMKQISENSRKLFMIEDIENIGPYYDKTLMAWWENFSKNWPQLKGKYGQRFYRTWKLYLQGCAGSFRAGNLEDWQITFRKT
ncbi:MAG: cyclopropane fatty acyl phospholipid synthase [Candidatus Berkelbacteria bacterium]|nr:cyclopropane fatty acyl phospholipid synthase [Candidatus Berkelbacteria bacterium]